MIDGLLLRDEHTFKTISEWIKVIKLHIYTGIIILDVKCTHMGDFPNLVTY